MKTEAQTFCTEFSDVLKPFSQSLQQSISDLRAQKSSSFGKTSLSLQEVEHRLSALKEKIDGQHAYLLIFGPLKSGKSTLMNAISGTYVSEVSSLPAYPALVYVKNGEEKRFQATTYAGEKIAFKNNDEMTAAIEEGHRQLAKRILEVENQGENFEPKQHYSEAIRRMDVEAPAESLAESGTVLVDTPGLYSRMRFGYDLMTRDFRDSAACAIFVVKTDNLFFEKVFEEFNQLLGCFNRIFLVANIDTSKNDLNPDGTLRPSLESSDPDKIISAFENLSMSAPLKQAHADGRLRVYPIDLLKAASKRLQESVAPKPASDTSNEPNEETEKDGFDLFLGDLSEYLNSSDYLHDFMYDSLRFANDLRTEAAKVVDHESAENLRQEAAQLENDLEKVNTKIKSIDSIGVINWNECFSGLNAENDTRLNALSEKYSASMSEDIEKEIDAWMETDSSMAVLRGKLKDILEGHSKSDNEQNLAHLKSLIKKDGGARFTSNQIQAFAAAELDLGTISSKSLSAVEEVPEQDFRQFAIAPEVVPVKKGFLDFLLFRSPKKISERFFGADGGQPIKAGLKQNKLTDGGVDALKTFVKQYASVDLVNLHKDQLSNFVSTYSAGFSDALGKESQNLKATLQEKAQSHTEQLKKNAEALKIFTKLLSATEVFRSEIVDFAVQFNLKAIDTDTPAIEPAIIEELTATEAESTEDIIAEIEEDLDIEAVVNEIPEAEETEAAEIENTEVVEEEKSSTDSSDEGPEEPKQPRETVI